jgi:hypothetical protein
LRWSLRIRTFAWHAPPRILSSPHECEHKSCGRIDRAP